MIPDWHKIWRGVPLVVVAALIACGIFLYGWTLVEIRSQQDANTRRDIETHENTVVLKRLARQQTQTEQRVKELLAQFQDCVQPAGKCAKRNAKATAAVILALETNFKRTVVLAAVCASDASVIHTPTGISACIGNYLTGNDGGSQ